MPKKAYVLVFDGYADWEIGFALAEIRRTGGLEVEAAGFDGGTVVSMGGLHVVPQTVISKIDPSEALVFILPGGHLWEQQYPVDEVEDCLWRMERAGVPIAALCAGTTVLARAGILRQRRHTSNSREYLERVAPDATNPALYVDKLAVTDRGVITASGLGALEAAREIFELLDIATPQMREGWYRAFKSGVMPKGYY
ncbi:DJ-1/PfpI family protein [bacterium]|nr:DJ-1/PfpI family protein [bacterium]